MNDLRNKFIRQSAADLDELVSRFQDIRADNVPPNFLREISHKIHTVKGTAQTFDLPDAAQFAHQLENLLETAKTDLPVDLLQSLLIEGISILSKLLRGENVSVSAEFTEKIGGFKFTPTTPNLTKTDLPEAVNAKLSDTEKSAAAAALEKGTQLSVVEVYFEKTNFAADFKTFRAELESAGDIIAVVPNPVTKENKIGFQIVFAPQIINLPVKQKAKGLDEVFAAISAHGESVARRLQKKCRFTVAAESCELFDELSDDLLKTIFDALLHLVRNAVDHGIANEGSIEISAKTSGENIILTVADEGSGLDAEKIKIGAARRNLISKTEQLSERQIHDLIFAPGFSTAEKLSEFSGRGTGLDAVRAAIEGAGGKISVISEFGSGTAFEIVLPVKVSKNFSVAD